MHRFVNRKVVIGLTLSTAVLLIACMVLAAALLSRSRFERTRQFGVMFDTETARLCNADAPTVAPSFAQFMQSWRRQHSTAAESTDPDSVRDSDYTPPSRPYCKDLK